jgi:2-haloacid dehalogenase
VPKPALEPVSAGVFDVGRGIGQWRLRALVEKLSDDAQELDWFLANVVTEEWHFQHDAGRPLDEMVPERKAQFPKYAHLIDAYRAGFLETVPGPIPGTADLIERLDAAGVPLFAITNFGAEFWDQFYPTQSVLKRFRDIVVSGREKLAKPDPAIFHLGEQRFGHAANSMLFIDDNVANIESANVLGWHTHLFTDAVTLEEDLTARGLLSQ